MKSPKILKISKIVVQNSGNVFRTNFYKQYINNIYRNSSEIKMLDKGLESDSQPCLDNRLKNCGYI